MKIIDDFKEAHYMDRGAAISLIVRQWSEYRAKEEEAQKPPKPDQQAVGQR